MTSSLDTAALAWHAEARHGERRIAKLARPFFLALLSRIKSACTALFAEFDVSESSTKVVLQSVSCKELVLFHNYDTRAKAQPPVGTTNTNNLFWGCFPPRPSCSFISMHLHALSLNLLGFLWSLCLQLSSAPTSSCCQFSHCHV